MNEDFYNEGKLRDFLLGNLAEAECAAAEERFLAEEDFAAQLLVVEDELIEDYLLGELAPKERERFEAAFLTQAKRRERVLVMKGVLVAANAEFALRTVPTPSFWANLAATWRLQTALARYASAAGVVFVLALTGLFLLNRLGPDPPGRLAQNNPVLTIPSPLGAGAVPVPTETPATRPTSSPAPATQPAGTSFATVILHPTLARDPSVASKLVISPSVKEVRLQLVLAGDDYKSYAVRLTTVEGKVVWQANSLHARLSGGATLVVCSLSSQRLPTGDYLVDVSGTNDAGGPASLASYFLSVTRK